MIPIRNLAIRHNITVAQFSNIENILLYKNVNRLTFHNRMSSVLKLHHFARTLTHWQTTSSVRLCHLSLFRHSILPPFASNHNCISSNICYKHSLTSPEDYLDCTDSKTMEIMLQNMKVIFDFISEEEEKGLVDEIEPHLKRLHYENSHWDDAIHGYRETERKNWTDRNKVILQRVHDTAFHPGVVLLPLIHVLDLKKEGVIKPHVDAVKFCGSTIAGISLLSPSVMRLVHTENKTEMADILLQRRSLYIMRDEARYKYTHEILPQELSKFKGKEVIKDRRISVISRNAL